MSSSIDVEQGLPSLDPGNMHTGRAGPVARPLIMYYSSSTLISSLWRRFCSIWTQRFVLSLLAGQMVSLCIACTDVTTTELVRRNWSLPTTQTFFLWVLI